jgi:hypothetical protein
LVGVAVLVGVLVGVSVLVGVTVLVGVSVLVGVGVSVFVGVGVGVTASVIVITKVSVDKSGAAPEVTPMVKGIAIDGLELNTNPFRTTVKPIFPVPETATDGLLLVVPWSAEKA